MSPRTVTDELLQEAPTVRESDTVADALRVLLGSGLPAVPVVDGEERFAGIFGEREFLEALFPGYLKELKYAGFVKRSLDEALEREECRDRAVSHYMNREHVDVGPDFSDIQIAETFIHHRVLLVPVTDEGRVRGVITRAGFFRSVAERFLVSDR